MTTHSSRREAGLRACLAVIVAVTLQEGAAHASLPEAAVESGSAVTQDAPSYPETNSLDESGAFAARPNPGVVIDDSDFRSEEPATSS